MPRVVITMPAYRAAETLAKTVADIPVGAADELILVDDASPDNTVDFAREMGIQVHVHHRNLGYGGNQKTCYRKALDNGADVVVLLHPDYQYDPKAVPLLVAPILAGHADMTFGSRFAAMGNPRAGGMPAFRFVGNRVTTTLENLFVGSRFTEMHSGMRAYTRRCLLALPFLRYPDDFTFDSQFLLDAITSGQRVVEVPIATRYTKESSSISILRSLQYVAHGVGYAARVGVTRGRRGARSPVGANGPRRSRALATGRTIEWRCVLCGKPDMLLAYPSNATVAAESAEFSCTSGALSTHDDIVQCPCCGMVSSVPPLQTHEILDRYTDMEDETYMDEEQGRRQLFSWVLGRIGGYALRGNRLLEVGSNLGLFLDEAGRRGFEARGLEPSRWCVDYARRHFGVAIEQEALETYDAGPGSADVVVALDVLEHLVDPLDALRRMRRLVDGEGVVAVSTVDVSSLHARLRKSSWPWFIRPHLHYFTPETLHAILAEAGLHLVEWAIVPRSFHLGYVANRMASSHGGLGRLLQRLARIADPKVPLGWLGDVVLAVARPAPATGEPGAQMQPRS